MSKLSAAVLIGILSRFNFLYPVIRKFNFPKLSVLHSERKDEVVCSYENISNELVISTTAPHLRGYGQGLIWITSRAMTSWVLEMTLDGPSAGLYIMKSYSTAWPFTLLLYGYINNCKLRAASETAFSIYIVFPSFTTRN